MNFKVGDRVRNVKTGRTGTVTEVLQLDDPVSGLAHEIAEALKLRQQATPTTVVAMQAPDDPQATFRELAERTSKVLGISLSDAYSRVASEAPTLYQRARAKAML
jgi:hypothetical protein